MQIAEMTFEKELILNTKCEPFMLSDSQIILRGFIAYDF